MGFVDALTEANYVRLAWTALIFVPILDKELLAVVPVVRSSVPGVEPLSLVALSWSERLRWGIVVIAPGIDGEVLNLADLSVRDVIED
jgi:hypothetical protein